MFDEFAAAEGAAPPDAIGVVGEPDREIPAEAYIGAPLDEDGHPMPEWLLDGGRAVVLIDAVRPADAWEAAANLLQSRLDDAEVSFRRAELARVDALTAAAAASMQDLRVRYGLGDSQVESHGVRTFARQTGLALAMSPARVLHLLETATTAARTLPRTWAHYRTLGCSWRALELAVLEAEGLPAASVAAFDALASALAASTPITRLGEALRKARERLQDDSAAARARTTEQKRTVRFTAGRDGAASLTLHGPAAALAAIDTALTKAAVASKVDDEPRTVTQLRHDVALDLLTEGMKVAADPDQAGTSRVPTRKGVDVVAAVTIPALAWLGVTAEQATLEGVGPIALDTALALAADAQSLVRILTDPVTGTRLALDRSTYRPPADLARWVRYRDQRCRFPGCSRRAAECDLDHAREWQDGGVTDDANLVTLCRGDHVRKTMRLYREELRDTGHVDWTSPWGRRSVDPPPDAADPAPRQLLPDVCPF